MAHSSTLIPEDWSPKAFTLEQLQSIKSYFEFYFWSVTNHTETSLRGNVQSTCSICQTVYGVEETYKLIQCGDCYSYYHMSCLDPPLKRVPRGYVWRCESCDESEDEDIIKDE